MPAPQTQQPRRQAQAQAGGTTYEDVAPGYVSGNLTKDPELRYTPKGVAVAMLRVAEQPRVRDPESGEWKDGPTTYHDVSAWAEMGERAAEALAKGDRIAACGTWQRQTWTDQAGEQRSKLVLVARDLGPSLLFRQAWPERGDGKGGR